MLGQAFLGKRSPQAPCGVSWDQGPSQIHINLLAAASLALEALGKLLPTMCKRRVKGGIPGVFC